MDVLSGFDRVRFRGSVRSISYAGGFLKYLCFIHVLLKFAADFINGTSRKLRAATERLAQNTPVGKVVYLAGNHDKQEVVDALMKEHGVADDFVGLIAVLSCVENCRSFEVHKNADAGLLQLRPAARKCLHYYLYLRHPRFGRMHLRIMTWFPMQVQICLNGREWLARQLDAAGIAYERRDNSFAWVADFAKAQALLDEQVATDWSKTLAELLQEVHPAFAALRSELQLRDYYWTAEQTEVATDVAFRSEKTLAPLYRRLLRHAMENLSSGDVMRFLQQRLTKSGAVRRNFAGELVSDLQVRREGTRVKHRLGANSVKTYDKFGVILRIETTIHEAEGLKVYRPKENDPEQKLAWRPLRRGVADLHRRFELSRRSNATYLEAMSAVEVEETVGTLAGPASRPAKRGGRRYRGLNLLSAEDSQLLRAIQRGEHAISGFRNRDLCAALFVVDPVFWARRGVEYCEEPGMQGALSKGGTREDPGESSHGAAEEVGAKRGVQSEGRVGGAFGREDGATDRIAFRGASEPSSDLEEAVASRRSRGVPGGWGADEMTDTRNA